MLRHRGGRALLTGIILATTWVELPAHARSCPELVARYFQEPPGSLSDISVVADFRSLLPSVASRSIGRSSEILSQAEFESIFRALEARASARGIALTPKSETIGVFPDGMAAIGISGFGHLPKGEAPGFVARHELAHLIHTIELRTLLLESYGRRTVAELTPQELLSCNQRLKLWEEGLFNYAEFEKMVGRASSAVHGVAGRSPKEGRRLYLTSLEELIEGTSLIVDSGRVRFPNHWDLEGTYSFILSRAPFIVGRSGAELAMRLPVLIFATAYASNLPLEGSLAGLKFPVGYLGRGRGFRDWVHAWASDAVRR